MKILPETKRDFLKNINSIRNNDRLTDLVYSGHTKLLDNLLFKIIVYFIEIKQTNYADTEFKTFVESIYDYTIFYNPELKNIDITEVQDYKRGNPFDDYYAVYHSCGLCYPKFDIVLGVISGIPMHFIKSFVEIAKGNHESLDQTRVLQLSGIWIIK